MTERAMVKAKERKENATSERNARIKTGNARGEVKGKPQTL